MAISRWFDIDIMLLIVIRLFSQTDSLLSHFLSAQKYKWAPVEYQQNLMTYLEAPCNSISCWGVTIFIVTLDPGISFTCCVLQTFEDLTELDSTFQVCELENLSWLGQLFILTVYTLLLVGVLLYGPPGTGKTLMARACAAQTKVRNCSVCLLVFLKQRDLFPLTDILFRNFSLYSQPFWSWLVLNLFR